MCSYKQNVCKNNRKAIDQYQSIFTFTLNLNERLVCVLRGALGLPRERDIYCQSNV